MWLQRWRDEAQEMIRAVIKFKCTERTSLVGDETTCCSMFAFADHFVVKFIIVQLIIA